MARPQEGRPQAAPRSDADSRISPTHSGFGRTLWNILRNGRTPRDYIIRLAAAAALVIQKLQVITRARSAWTRAVRSEAHKKTFIPISSCEWTGTAVLMASIQQSGEFDLMLLLHVISYCAYFNFCRFCLRRVSGSTFGGKTRTRLTRFEQIMPNSAMKDLYLV
jgi:hypothetical protein